MSSLGPTTTLMETRCSFSLFFFLVLSHLSAQNSYKKQLAEFVEEQKQEKIYLHFDKPQYAVGEDIWLKAYVTNSVNHLPTTVSSTLHVELIDPQKNIIDSLTLFIEDGVARGNLTLRRNLPSGSYRVRAYTEWMRNFDEEFFFRKILRVVNASSVGNEEKTEETELLKPAYIVEFLPEGGDLIEGIPTKIAIKSTRSNGKGFPVAGTIINSNGQKITDFKTSELGYAAFILKPKGMESYRALVAEDTFRLPPVKDSGVSMRIISSYQSDIVHIGLQAKGIDLRGGTIIIHRRGQFLFSETCTERSRLAVKMKKSQLGTGVIHVTFFNRNQVPLTERLFFPNPPVDESRIVISPSTSLYNKRSKVVIELNSMEDTVHSASVTINPQKETSYERYGKHIGNYFLLTSDLKGTIESPGYYFSGTKEAYKSLDLLMLTHGWSRFDWTFLQEEKEFTPKYFPEEGLKIAGKANNFFNDKNLKEPILGVTIPSLGIIDETFQIASDGDFQLEGLRFMDSTRVYIQAYKEKNEKTKKDSRAQITLTYPARPIVTPILSPEDSVNQEFMVKTKKLQQISQAYFLDTAAIELDEVMITAKNYKLEEMNERTFYRKPSNRMILDSLNYPVLGLTVFDLLRRLPGINVTGAGLTQSATIRGGTPIYFLDGAPIDSSVIQNLPIQEVDFIDVLRGPEAVIFGNRGGAGGAILIYTRRGGSILPSDQAPAGLLAFTHPGYHKAKQFYSPRYDIPKEEHIVPDYRTTLHWEPDLQFQDGQSEIDFFASDQTGSYVIRVEGILKNGEPFFEQSFINIQ